MKIIKRCPKCKTINPKTKWWMGMAVSGIDCNETTRTYLFGLIKIKCKHTLEYDFEGDLDTSYEYIKDNNLNKNIQMKNYKRIKAKDKFNNIINLFEISQYQIEGYDIILHLKSGGKMKLTYKDSIEAKKRYNKFLKYEKEHSEIISNNWENYCDEQDY